QRAKSKEQRAKSKEQRAKSKEQRTKIQGQRNDSFRRTDSSSHRRRLRVARPSHSGLFARWLFGFDRTRFCRSPARDVARSDDGLARALRDTHRRYELSDYLVDYRFGTVRCRAGPNNTTKIITTPSLHHGLKLTGTRQPNVRSA